LGSPCQDGIAGIRKSRIATAIAPNEKKLDTPPHGEREAEHEQQIADHRAGERPAHHLGEAVVDGDERNDQLRCVPERRVEEAADPRAGALGGVLGRLADQPGEGDERCRGQHELGGCAEVGRVVEHDRERAEKQTHEEDAADHGPGTLVRRRLVRSGEPSGLPVSTGGVKSCASRSALDTIQT
jgi:hypothetical protein